MDEKNVSKRAIEFVHELDEYTKLDKKIIEPLYSPLDFDNVSLLKKTIDGFDIILAWNDNDECSKTVFLGHWNDGIVEEY
jgi:hypothetical protein